MSSVLVHIGCTGPYISGPQPPACLEDCVDQYRIFNDDDLYILTDGANIPHLPKHKGVIPVALEDYYSDKVAQFESLWHYPPREFWTVAVTRFIYLENFLRDTGLEHVCHFENDVLVYFNIEEYLPVFKRLYRNLAITPGGHNIAMTGFMYIDNHAALEAMTKFFIDIMSQYGVEGAKKRFDLYALDEMRLLRLFSTVKGDEFMGLLPILPFGMFSQGFGSFGTIFDPATWGQFIGGTRTAGPGAKFSAHYIGLELIEHPHFKVDWVVENGLSVPYFNDGTILTKINNLHIHSKNLHLYRSDVEC